MTDETMVKGVAGHFIKDQSSLDSDRIKAKEKDKLLKERILDEKMKLIRKKNEERLRRQKEIEEDIKNAILHSNQVTEEKPATSEDKMAGVQKDSSFTTRMRGRARGRILAKMAKEELHAHRFENKRIRQNYEDVENELQQERLKDSSLTSTSSFLSNDHRVDMSNVPSRSIHSWGGSQFEDVVEKVNKEKNSRPKRENQNIEVSMTGRERKEYLEWKEERSRIDQERKLRQKSGENWKREWDREKAKREVHSTHERQDQHHHHPRSGQRFGERTRWKPDWDLHDDRVPEKYDKENNEDEEVNWEDRNAQKNSIASHDKVEYWDDSSTTSLEGPSESDFKDEAISSPNVEDNTTTSIEEIDDSNTNNETTDTTAIHLDICEECHTTDKVDSKEFEKTARLRMDHEEASKNIDIRNLTVTIDSKGKRNISDDPINNNIKSLPDETTSTVSDNTCESNEEAARVKHDEIIEQPKPQRTHKKVTRHRKEKDTENSKDQENVDITKEMLENHQTESSEIATPTPKNTTNQEVGSDSTTYSTPSHLKKANNTLPKLEINREDENTEVVPDFLKTPQKKNWADCEFDEELDLPPLEWGSLSN